MESFFTMIIAPILTMVLGALITSFIKDYRWTRDYKQGPKIPKKGWKKNSVLVAGMGRVGKSTLVQNLVDLEAAQNQIVTEDFDVYPFTHYSPKTGNKINFAFNDYRGQNITQLVAGMVREQLNRKTHLRYGDIHSLVIVVDLFSPEDLNASSKIKYDDINKERVKQNLDYWHLFALDVIFGFLKQGSLRFVCLFINKTDGLKLNLNDEIRKLILEEYSELIKLLEMKTKKSGASFDVIMGSASETTHLLGGEGILGKLAKFSIPKTQ